MKYFTLYKFNEQNLPYHTRVESILDADILIVVGGDGSIIEGTQYLVYNNCTHVRILGINTGHVGFLSNNIDLADVFRILQGDTARWPDYHFVKRKLLRVTSNKGIFFGINEVVVHPSKFGSLLTTDILINNVPVSYQGDGLIIATSYGSTAYNLSAGGPIVMPELDSLCITPISPFTMASRPLVVPSDAKIQLLGTGGSVASVDGVDIKDNKGVVELSDVTIEFIKTTSFMDDIQTKLGWNKNIKN